MTMIVKKVLCPHCGQPVEWTNAAKWRPFCSERCYLIDLGAWANEQYTIPDNRDDNADDKLLD